MITIENFVNKEVDFYFEGKNLHFKLSQSLFSSFEIDKGSKLLLKSIAKSIDISNVKTLLDIGSGVGVLGIAIKSLNPEIEVFSQDRDALAVEFTKLNAKTNNMQDIQAFGSLALTFPKTFDLILSNLPAKAGEPVLRAIIKGAPQYNTPGGICAFVIVEPLKNLFIDEIHKNNFELISESSTKKHSVFIYRETRSKFPHYQDETKILKPYLRGSLAINDNYKINTVYGIKNFNSIDFETELTISLLNGKSLRGNILIWNPYQGYIPIYIYLNNQNSLDNTVIASRDYLSLLITKHNMKKIIAYQSSQSKAHYLHYPFFNRELYNSNNFDYTIIALDRDPGIDYSKEILEIANNPASIGKSMIVTGSSHQIALLKKSIKKKKVLKTKKYRGYSGIFIWFT